MFKLKKKSLLPRQRLAHEDVHRVFLWHRPLSITIFIIQRLSRKSKPQFQGNNANANKSSVNSTCSSKKVLTHQSL